MHVGDDQYIAISGSATLDATVTDDGLPNPPGACSFLWTQQSGPGTATFGDDNAVDTTASFSETGAYVLRLTADDGGLTAYDEVTIEVVADGVFILPMRIQAEDYHNHYGVYVTTTNDVDGEYDLYTLGAGDWASYNVYVPVTGNYTIVVRARPAYSNDGKRFRIEVDDVDMTGIIGPTVADTYMDVVVEDVELTAGNHVLKYYQAASWSWNSRVNWIEVFIPPNVPPTVDAGEGQCIAPVTATAALSGTVSDDGLPNPPRAVTVTWTKESGPGTVTFGNPDCLDTTAAFNAAGTYVLRLTADDGGAQPYDTVVVGVSDRFMLPAKIQAEDYRYGGPGLGYDDTTPGNDGGEYRDDDVDIYATSDTGGGYTIRNPAVGEWTAYDVNVPATGTYDFTFRVSSEDAAPASLDVLFDGESVISPTWSSTGGYDTYTDVVMQDVALTAGDHVMTVVRNNDHWSHGLNWIEIAYRNIPPAVDAGDDQTVIWPANTATLDATVTDDGLPDPPAAVTTTWTKQSGPGTVTFGNAAAVDTTATFSAKGVYVLRLTADDGHTPSYDEITITLLADYFVSKQGSDANDGTSWETAFLTVQKGVDALAPGDRLTIGPGEYFESVNRTDLGGPDADTVIRAKIPGTAVLRGDVAAPAFAPVDGYQFVYAAPFAQEPRVVLDHNSMHTFFPKANVIELEFDPGFFHYDATAGMLYISNPDLSPPDQGRYTVSLAEEQALDLTRPQRVIVDGLAAAGFNFGVLMIAPESCTVRNGVFYMNTGGVIMQAPDGIGGEEGGSDNLVENCVAYGNTYAGIARYSADNDTIRNNYMYRNVRENNEHFGIIHYGTMYGPFLMQDNIAWGHNFNYSVKSGNQYEQLDNCVGLGYIRISNTRMSHNLIAGGNEYGTNPPADNILFGRETNLNKDFEFADPDNLDFRLQPDSRFVGTGPGGVDRGPYPYEANIYYVSPAGNDQLNDGLSMRTPWRTLARAFSALQPGDTVYLSEGQYAAATLTGAGDGEAPIRILGRSRGTVVISGVQNVTKSAGLVFERLDFDGGVALTDTDDAAFKNCTFFGAAVGLDADGVAGLEVTHCLFDDATFSVTGSGDVMLSGNVYANATVHAVSLDAAAAILYLDYNGYQDTTNCWEVNSATWSLADVRHQYHDIYSLAVTPTLAVVAGVPRMEPDPEYASAGPNDTALGIYYEYDISPKTLDLVGPFVHSVSDVTANIEWWTSHPATYSLAWGETEACENTVSNFRTSGRFTTFSLTDLTPGQTYYFKIVSADARSADPNLAVLYPTDPPLSFTTDAAPAAARTFYVAPDGDDANDGLSRANALRTICRAADRVGPGDTVLLATGDYPETVRIRTAGTSTRPITFRCIAGEKPTLQLAYLPLSFELVRKPDIRFDGLYFEGQDMWREGFVLQESPRVQITRCMDTMVSAANSPDLLVKNCVILGGWNAVGISNSAGSIIENNFIASTILRDVSASSAVTVRKNIFSECIRNKMHQTLTQMSGDVTESDNCFYIQRPETDKLAVNNLELPIYQYQTGSNSLAANPMTPAGTGFYQGWPRAGHDEFDQCWTANPDLILRDIGLQQTAFSDFVFDPPAWPYTLAWATDFVADRDAAEAFEAAGQDANALAAYNDMLADHPMCDRLKSEILTRASLCAERLNDYTQATQLAQAIPLAPLSMHRRMELMLAQGLYAELIAAFNQSALGGRTFYQSYTYPEHEDVMGDLYYYRATAYIETGNLTAAEADLKVMNDKREQLSYMSGVLIHDEASLRLGNFYRHELLDDDLALEQYLDVCDRTTWEPFGTVDKGVLTGNYESLELATTAACEIYRSRGDEQSALDLEASLAQAQADAEAALQP